MTREDIRLAIVIELLRARPMESGDALAREARILSDFVQGTNDTRMTPAGRGHWQARRKFTIPEPPVTA